MACSKLEARGHLLHKTGTPPKHFSRECKCPLFKTDLLGWLCQWTIMYVDVSVSSWHQMRYQQISGKLYTISNLLNNNYVCWTTWAIYQHVEMSDSNDIYIAGIIYWAFLFWHPCWYFDGGLKTGKTRLIMSELCCWSLLTTLININLVKLV